MAHLSRYCARVLSPIGYYTSESIAFDDAVYIADEELSFVVYRPTVHTRGGETEGASYSETQWLNPSEIRLMGSILMCLEIDDGSVVFYPHTTSEPLDDGPNVINDRDWLV